MIRVIGIDPGKRTGFTEDEKVYFFEPLKKEISVEDMQKVVDTNERLVKELKDDAIHGK